MLAFFPCNNQLFSLYLSKTIGNKRTKNKIMNVKLTQTQKDFYIHSSFYVVINKNYTATVTNLDSLIGYLEGQADQGPEFGEIVKHSENAPQWFVDKLNEIIAAFTVKSTWSEVMAEWLEIKAQENKPFVSQIQNVQFSSTLYGESGPDFHEKRHAGSAPTKGEFLKFKTSVEAHAVKTGFEGKIEFEIEGLLYHWDPEYNEWTPEAGGFGVEMAIPTLK